MTVLHPGMWSENHLEEEDFGFPEERQRKDRPRLRLGMTITATVLCFLLAAATAYLFVRLADYAVTELPDRAGSTSIIQVMDGGRSSQSTAAGRPAA